MKKLSLFISLALLSLLALFLFLPPKQITSPEQLTNLQENQKVVFQSEIKNQRITETKIFLTLTNNFTAYCSRPCPFKFQENQKITITAKIENFPNKNTLKIISVENA